VLLACSCGGSQAASTSPSPTPVASPSASPSTVSQNGETPVPQEVLAPAESLPVGNLCSASITVNADGTATPLICQSGALNVLAWRFYAGVSASVLGLGLNPTEGQVESAICDDLKHNNASRTEEAGGYKLATTYYGWTFSIDVSRVSCQ
jgi:hypothetical protein